MKIIDLLNKIANNEKVPKRIKVGYCYYELYKRLDNYYSYKRIDIDSGEYLGDYLSNSYFFDDKDVLNWEVEIIEENKGIEKLNYKYTSDVSKLKMAQKIDEIIDKLNETKE